MHWKAVRLTGPSSVLILTRILVEALLHLGLPPGPAAIVFDQDSWQQNRGLLCLSNNDLGTSACTLGRANVTANQIMSGHSAKEMPSLSQKTGQANITVSGRFFKLAHK